MPNLSEQMVDHVQTVFLQTEHFAETISWIDPGQAARDVIAQVSAEEVRISHDEDEKATVYEVEIRCSVADVPSVTPHASKATFHGITWTAYAENPLQHGMRKIMMRGRRVTSLQKSGYETGG